MIPYCRHEIRSSDQRAVARVLASDRLTQGPAVSEFESALAGRTGAAAAIAVSSGTSALQIALAAQGVGPGDEVIVPALTFVATANAVLMVGARPVFADIDAETLMLDPEDVARRITPRTRGAILVHYAGHPGDVDGLRAVLGEGRFLIEDACHALGAERGGRPVGQDSEMACFSFHPAKHVAAGEGGAVVVRSPGLARRCRSLREHGIERDPQRRTGLGLPTALGTEEQGGWVYEMQGLSGNHRLSDLSASLGHSQLGRLDEGIARRREIVRRYDARLAQDSRLFLLPEPADTRSAWHLYPIRVRPDATPGGRAGLYGRLHAAGIGVQVHYIPVHLQPYYRKHLGSGWGDLPVTETAYLGLLSLPLFPTLSEGDQERTLATLARALDGAGA